MRTGYLRFRYIGVLLYVYRTNRAHEEVVVPSPERTRTAILLVLAKD